MLALIAGALAHALQTESANKHSSDRAVLARARALSAEHKLQAATDLLRAYVERNAGDVAGLTLLAQVRLDAGDAADAQRFFEEALSANPEAREANLGVGKLLLSEQHYPEAMDRFETVLSKSPEDTEARGLELDAVTKLAASAAQGGNPQGALKALQHAQSKMPGSSRLLTEEGLAALEVGLFAEATDDLQAAHRLSPADPDIAYATARLDLEEQHMPQAEANLRTYLAARPNDATAHFGLGRVLAMEQRNDEAKREFLHSAAIQPLQTESYYEIGQIDLQSNENVEASAMFQRVISRDPRHGGALTGLGEVAYKERKYDLAEGFLTRATEAAPDYGPGHYYLGLVLSRLGKKSEAERELQIATELGEKAAAPVQNGQQTVTPH